jgi:ATP synthase protein I
LQKNRDNHSLEELGRKIDKAKRKLASDEAEKQTSAPGAIHVGIDLLAGVIGGSFFGYYIDKWLGTLPFFFITCFFLGIAGAVRNIIRTVRNANNEDNEK